MKPFTKRGTVPSGRALVLKRSILHKSKQMKKSKLGTAKAAQASSVMDQFQVSPDHGHRRKPRRYFDGPSTSARDSPQVDDLSKPSTSTSEVPRTSTRFSLPPLVIESPRQAHDESFYSLEGEESDIPYTTEDDEETTPTPPPRRRLRKKKGVKLGKRKRATSSSTAELTESDEELPKLFPVRQWGLIVAVLPHPSTLLFSGLALVEVISGAIKILGYVVEEEEDYRILPVFSSNKLLQLDIKTERPGRMCRQISRLQTLRKTLVDKFKIPEKVAEGILNVCNDDSVIIGFRKDFRSSGLRYVAQLMPSAVIPTKTKSEFGAAVFDDMDFTLNVGDPDSDYLEYPQCQKFVEDVLSCIKNSVQKNAPGPRVLVQGKKGMGKSTFLRYLINRVLNHYEAVLYLDADPGQCEFTPPGCVSLVRVCEPFMGPPCAHPTVAEKMYFIGTANVENAVFKYTTCIRLLADYYRKECSKMPLFVNTMGWVTGEGLVLLNNLKSFVSPTHVVNIVEEFAALGSHRSGRDRAPTMQCSGNLTEYTFVKFSPASGAKTNVSPADRRSLSMLAYLGKCQKTYMNVKPLNAIPPYGIHWKHVALHCGGVRSKNLAEHTLYAFNGSWVALLSVDESLMMTCVEEEFPKILSQDPNESECHGFGMIRATDISKKLFHVITPMSYKDLAKVNTLVKGDMQAPYVIYTSQVCEGQIPYVTQVIGKSNFACKNITHRTFRRRATSD